MEEEGGGPDEELEGGSDELKKELDFKKNWISRLLH
jgi:hypothetical protein